VSFEIRAQRWHGRETSTTSVFASDLERLAVQDRAERDECCFDTSHRETTVPSDHERRAIVGAVYYHAGGAAAMRSRHDDLRTGRSQSFDLVHRARGQDGRRGLRACPEQRRTQPLFSRSCDSREAVGVGMLPDDDAGADEPRQLVAGHAPVHGCAASEHAERVGAELRQPAGG